MTSTPDKPRLLGEGKYELLSPIGSGAMGEVWLARHVALDRVVAAKLLTRTGAAPGSNSVQAAERFVREARTASLLRHRNTVQLLDYGVDGEDQWLVMEYLEGRNLADELDEEGRMPAARAIAIASQVLAAVAEAHDYGIVHRDLKPANVMLVPWVDDDGRESELVKVVDFGIATLFRDAVTGEVAGTPEYMSPEQAQGLDLDPRTDVYSIGVVLHHMLVGDVPFRGDAALDVMLAHVNQPPRSLRAANPAVSERLEAVVLRALEKAPEDRFGSARAFRSELLALPEAQGLKPDSAPQLPPVVALAAPATGLASADSPTSSAAEAPRRRRWLLPVAGLAALAAGLAVVVASSGSGADGVEAPREGATGAGAASMGSAAVPQVEVAVVAKDAAAVEGPSATPDKNGLRPEADAQVAVVADTSVAVVADTNVAVVADTNVAVVADTNVAVVADTNVAVVADTNVAVAGVQPSDPRTKRLADAKAEAAKAKLASADAREKAPAVASLVAPEPAKVTPEPAKVTPEPAKVVPEPAKVAPEPAVVEPAKVEPSAPKLVPALAARVAVTQLAVRGSLPRSSVQRALDGVTPALAECYRRWASEAGHDQAASGTVSLAIDVDGGATRIAVGAWPMTGLAACITQSLARARTRDRPDTGTVEATFALVFSPLPPRGP